MPENNSNLTKGFAWTAVDRFSNLFIQFVLGIIIARLVTPAEYGILGLLMVFINISQVFIDSGLSSALIYHNKLASENLNTSFVFNISVSTIFYLIIFAFSPLIESFYHLHKLSLYLRVSAIVLFINSLVDVPTAILKIRLDFKSLAISNISSTLISGIIGIVFAYRGYGIWALIIQLLSRSSILMLLLYVQSRWIPKIMFDTEKFKTLYKYGINIFSASCLTKVIEEGSSFIIAKVLTPFSLGIYSRSQQFASLPSTSIGGIITAALFPSLSSIKDDEERFNKVFHKVIEYQAAICIPLFLWIAMAAEPLIKILLTEKWIAVAPVLQILCIGRILVPSAYITEQVINARGRSDLFLRQQIIKMLVKLTMILAFVRFGLLAIAIAEASYTIMQFFITNYLAKNCTTFLSKSQLLLIYPYIICAMVSAACGYLIIKEFSNEYAQLGLSLMIAILIYYMLIQIAFKKTIFLELIEKIYRRGHKF